MRIDELAGEALERADELLAAAAHDVAKYMALTARNVDPDALDDHCAARIIRELTATDGEQASWELWRKLSRELSELSDDERVGSVDRAMTDLEALASAAAPEHHGLLAKKALEVAESILALRRAVRRRLLEERQ